MWVLLVCAPGGARRGYQLCLRAVRLSLSAAFMQIPEICCAFVRRRERVRPARERLEGSITRSLGDPTFVFHS